MLQKLTCVTEISDLENDPVVRFLKLFYLKNIDDHIIFFLIKVCCPLNEISDSLVSNSNVPLANNNQPSKSSPSSTTQASTTTQTQTTRRSTTQTHNVELDNYKFKQLLPTLKECSISYVTDRIIGGVNVTHGMYPWMARLGYRRM